MSSHREAPAISKDPVADNTDVYAFVSPNRPDTVTLIANFIPFQSPDGGPNFYEFGDDVLYEIHVSNSGNPVADITYQFRFKTTVTNPNTFLYNIGPISSLTDPYWNRRQTYSVTKLTASGATRLANAAPCPPCNVGPRSTPNYPALAGMAVTNLPSGETVFAGQRAEGFYVDVGSVFDLGDLRPFQNLHLIPTPAAPGVNGTANLNVNTIAIQVPKTQLTRDGSNPTNPASASSVIGVWASASRKKARVRNVRDGQDTDVGPFVQVSRLANPLFNEVIVPMSRKDAWNANTPASESLFLPYVQHPELANLLPVLYPTAFPNLKALNGSNAVRDDLVAILLTGIPAGAISALPANFQTFTGPTPADMIRLNMAVAPTPMASANILGVLGGDLAGFPNGRRVFDDVTTIELRAIAGLTYQLLHPTTYRADAAAGLVTDFNSTLPGGAPSPVTPAGTGTIPIPPEGFYISTFPYLGVPYDGYSHPSSPAS